MTDRRQFIGSMVGLGVGLGASPAFPNLPQPSPVLPNLPHASPLQSAWDTRWTERITGKHRVVFDSPELSAGLALVRTLVWYKDYAEVYGTRPADMSSVVVLRHNAIWMVMDDMFWDHHQVGAIVKIDDPATGQPIRRNPFLGPTPFKDLPPAMADEVLRKVLATSSVLACNLAFHDVVEVIRPEAGGDAARARSMALRHLVPGIILQPSGVFAVNRAQEAGCHYFLAS